MGMFSDYCKIIQQRFKRFIGDKVLASVDEIEIIFEGSNSSQGLPLIQSTIFKIFMCSIMLFCQLFENANFDLRLFNFFQWLLDAGIGIEY